MEATDAAGVADSHVERMIAQGRKARGDARELKGSVEQAAVEARAALVEQLERRPYVTLGVATGLGYVVGVAFPRTGAVAMRVGGRIAMNMAVSRVVEVLTNAAAAEPGDG